MMTERHLHPWQQLRTLPNQEVPKRVDVVFGRGGKVHPNHPGNLVYNKLINTFRERFLSNRNLHVKQTIVESIVRAIHEKNGRFLEVVDGNGVDGNGGKWHEISDSQAVLRTGGEILLNRSNNNNNNDNNNNHGNPNLFAAAAMEQHRRNAVAQQEQQQLENQLRLQRQREMMMGSGSARSRLSMSDAAAFPFGLPMGGPLVGGNDRDRARAAVEEAIVAAELDDDRSMREEKTMERILLLRERQRQQQQVAHYAKQKENQYLQQQQQLSQVIRTKQEDIYQQQLKFQKSQPVGVRKITECDVIVVGVDSNYWTTNPGNVEIKKLLLANRKLYHTWPEKTRLKHISQSIVSTIRDRTGRFLQKRLLDSIVWHDIGDSEAIEWTSELLTAMYNNEKFVAKTKSQAIDRDMVAAQMRTNFLSVNGAKTNNNNTTAPVVPQLVDVLWARGLSQHPGNITYRKMILASMQDQSVLHWDESKLNAVTQLIVTAIKVEYNGRFLESVADNNDNEIQNSVWIEIGSAQAFEKTLVALRDAREKLLRHISKKEQDRNRQQDADAAAIAPPIMQSSATPEIPQLITGPGETDVVFGAGSGNEALKHPGNQVYRSLISCNTGRYRTCELEEKKRRICQSVVAAIKGQDGRFLKLNRNTGLWYALSDSVAIGLTAAILQRVDKKKSNPQRLQGTMAKPIDVCDDDDDDDEDEIPMASAPREQQEKWIRNDKKRQKKAKLRKDYIAMMAQDLYDIQETRYPGNIVLKSEYRAIENAAKKKIGSSIPILDVSRKLIQKKASDIRLVAKKRQQQIANQLATKEDERSSPAIPDSEDERSSPAIPDSEDERSSPAIPDSDEDNGYDSDESLVF